MKLLIATEDYITETLAECLNGKLPDDCRICMLVTDFSNYEMLSRKIWCNVVKVPLAKRGYLGQTTKNDAEKAFRKAYPEISRCLSFEMNEDVMLICGGKNEATYLADLLQELEAGLKLSIHLMCTMPLKVEGKLRNTRIRRAVKNVTGIKSLFLHEGEEVFSTLSKRESLREAFNKITADYAEQIIQAVAFVGKISDAPEKQIFHYDRRRKGFVLNKYEINKEGGDKEAVQIIPEELTQYNLFEDGKNVCRLLRKIRQKFAEDNSLEYSFEKCDYEGPCAGTCETCDLEADELLQLARNKRPLPVFNVVDIACSDNGKV